MSTTTAAQAIEEAHAIANRGDIYRLPPTGFSAPVSIQTAPPYQDGRFAGMVVQHCGISVAYALNTAGLTMGVDFPDTIQYAPALLQSANTDTPAPGDIGVIDWEGDGEPDHVVLIIDVADDGSCTTWEANTTTDGRVYYYQRDPSLFAGYVRPNYAAVPGVEPAAGVVAGGDGSVAAQVYAWGVTNGLTDAGIAGLLGNMQQESLIDPAIVEGMTYDLADIVPGVREGIGLCQWSYSRREGLLAYAAAAGRAWQDVDVQLAWILAECAANPDYAAGLDALRVATDPVAAAYAWEAAYEGAAIIGPRGDYAAQQLALILAGAYGRRTGNTPDPVALTPPGVPRPALFLYLALAA